MSSSPINGMYISLEARHVRPKTFCMHQQTTTIKSLITPEGSCKSKTSHPFANAFQKSRLGLASNLHSSKPCLDTSSRHGWEFKWHSNRHAPRSTKERKVRSKIRWFTENLQFTLLIAVRCVLHRCENQEIHCWKLYSIHVSLDSLPDRNQVDLSRSHSGLVIKKDVQKHRYALASDLQWVHRCSM